MKQQVVKFQKVEKQPEPDLSMTITIVFFPDISTSGHEIHTWNMNVQS